MYTENIFQRNKMVKRKQRLYFILPLILKDLTRTKTLRTTAEEQYRGFTKKQQRITTAVEGKVNVMT